MMKNCFFMFIALFYFALFTSCKHPFELKCTEETQTVFFPSWPNSDLYPELLHWKVVITTSTKSYEKLVEATSDSTNIIVDKNYPVSVLAYPVTKSGNESFTFFYPCGKILPCSNMQSGTKLTWQSGATSNILRTLYRCQNEQSEKNRIFASYFNWNKLDDFIIQKEDENKDFNPWNIDKEKLIDCILKEKVTVYSTKLLSCKSFEKFEILEKIGDLYGIDFSLANVNLLSPYVNHNDGRESFSFLCTKTFIPAFLLNGNTIILERIEDDKITLAISALPL